MASHPIAGSRILITGASQGIGRALAELAALRGGRVLAAARSLDLLHDLAGQLRARGAVLEVVQADIVQAADRQRMVAAAQQHFGGLDILVNNAGIGATGPFADAGPERLRQIIEVNFFGTIETIRAFLPMLRATAAAKPAARPAIVNIGSILGKRAFPGRSEYSASKYAVQGFTEALRAELDHEGIDVLIINPGLTQTNFSRNMLERRGFSLDHARGMTSEQAAAATLRAIERGRRETNLTRGGWWLVLLNRLFPRLVDLVFRHYSARMMKQGAAPAPEKHEPASVGK
jgi:short-subunit dehydrogenase